MGVQRYGATQDTHLADLAQHAYHGEVWDQALQEHPDNEVLLDTVKKLRQ